MEPRQLGAREARRRVAPKAGQPDPACFGVWRMQPWSVLAARRLTSHLDWDLGA